jgi:hypothetical protein
LRTLLTNYFRWNVLDTVYYLVAFIVVMVSSLDPFPAAMFLLVGLSRAWAAFCAHRYLQVLPISVAQVEPTRDSG